FDEQSHLDAAAHYRLGTFFFDVQPPLGNLVFSFVAMIIGPSDCILEKDGHSGSEACMSVLTAMRFLSTVAGAATVAFAFAVLRELRVSHAAGLFGAVLLAFDTGLVLQSRLAEADSLLNLFTVAAVYSWVRAKYEFDHVVLVVPHAYEKQHQDGRPLLLGDDSGCSRMGASKYYGYWNESDQATFHVHFQLLTKSGPDSVLMSPSFQAGLQHTSLLRASSAAYGTTVKLRLGGASGEFLALAAPSKTEPASQTEAFVLLDDRQQTHDSSSVSFELHRPAAAAATVAPSATPGSKPEKGTATAPPPLRSGELVRLFHGPSGQFVAAATAAPTGLRGLSRYEADLGPAYGDTLWRVDVVAPGSGGRRRGDPVLAGRSSVRLVSVAHGTAIGGCSGAAAVAVATAATSATSLADSNVVGVVGLANKLLASPAGCDSPVASSSWTLEVADGASQLGSPTLLLRPRPAGFVTRLLELNGLMVATALAGGLVCGGGTAAASIGFQWTSYVATVAVTVVDVTACRTAWEGEAAVEDSR
ncbi:hypothetical protein HK405_006667, partial [Cladochytrium tenue]